MNEMNVAVIGSGYWGPNLVRNFAEMPSANLLGVADLREDRLELIRNRYPYVSTMTDYRGLFALPLDGVAVATPPITHFAIARECLLHDLHVLVEKPLTLDSRDAEKLIDVADRRGLVLMVGHTLEYHGAFRSLRELIAAGELGEIHYIDVVWVNLGVFQRDMNVLWDLAPHDISALLYLLRQDPITVSAQGVANVFEGKHDVAYLHLTFPDNISAHVEVSWLHPQKLRRITVVGHRKMAVIDDSWQAEKLRIYDKRVDLVCNSEHPTDFTCVHRSGGMVMPRIPSSEPLRVECEHFVDCSVAGKAPSSCGRSGLKVVKVLEAAEESLRNGGTAVGISIQNTEASPVGLRKEARRRAVAPLAGASSVS